MGTYNLPRNVKGEGRILFIFTTKSLIYTAIGAFIGLILYWILSMLGIKGIGIIFVLLFALIGYGIGMMKVPKINNIKWTQINAGQPLDDVIKRAIKFRKSGNKIYIYDREEKTNDR